jgi:hypothetical protein
MWPVNEARLPAVRVLSLLLPLICKGLRESESLGKAGRFSFLVPAFSFREGVLGQHSPSHAPAEDLAGQLNLLDDGGFRRHVRRLLRLPFLSA